MVSLLRLIHISTLLVTSLAVSHAAAAANSHSHHPIEIQANQFEMLLAERKTTYTGNVIATQGELSIVGTELIVYFNSDNEVTRMHARGVPATLTDDSQSPPVSLSGNTLDYNFDTSEVRAEGNSVLSQGGDTLAANWVVYNLNEERAQATGGESGRVRLNLAPKNKPED